MVENSREALLELAERVEKAEGADRESDCRIAELAGWSDVWQRDNMAEGWAPGGVCEASVPRYTVDLSAAMSLVPEGLDVAVGTKAGRGWAYIHNREMHFIGIGTRPNPAHFSVEVDAATPALALVSAALRARSAATA